jgi:Domain of unknown function (DUF4277)
MKAEVQIDVQDLDHLGIIAGIVDEIGIVEVIDREIGTDAREKVSAGQIVALHYLVYSIVLPALLH